jgi:hypothetical protein
MLWVNGFRMKIGTGFNAIVAAVTLIRIKSDGIVTFSHDTNSSTISRCFID